MTKNIVVTGASRGIGKAILEKYASEGWNIAFNSLNEDSVRKTTSELSQKYPTIKMYSQVCDMSIQRDVTDFANQAIASLGKIDILVNNAGRYTPGTISESNYDDQLEELMKVNLYSAYWIGKIIIPHMVSHQSGHIFTISSIAGLQAYPNGGSYAITKFALQGYIRTLREELKTKHIRVTGVYPGATYTDSWSMSDLPAERFVKPEDIAAQIYAISQLSPQTVVEDIVIRPQLGDI